MAPVSGAAVVWVETGSLHSAYATYAEALAAIRAMPLDARPDFDVVACEVAFPRK